MLRLQRKPDPVFLAILHDALELRLDEVRELAERGDADEWREFYPMLARYFTPQTLVSVLDRLITASKDTRLYQLTDYHWLVIYDCLETYSDVHNDMARESPDRMRPVGPYRIGRVEFDSIVQSFFWDTDFLSGDELVDVGAEFREQHGYSPEAFAIAAGLAPHPAELEIHVWDQDPDWDDAEDVPMRGDIPCYPPEVEEEK